jgi:superfamily I DNA/RNA helicase
MKSLTERVATRWMRAEDTEEPTESVGDVSPGVFVDLMAFFQAVAAYRSLRGDDDPITKRAAVLVRRFQNDLVAGTNRYFEPLTDDASFARLKPAVRILTRGTRGLDHASEQAASLRVVLGALHAKPQVVREVFSDSRSYTAAMRLSSLSATDSAGSLLNSVAALTPASRLQLTRKWIREAAAAANVAPSQVETVMADAESARHLGEDLHTVEVQLAAADPVSQRAADLQLEKQAILDQIETVVADSPSPSVVLSSAASAATQPHDYATQTAKRSKLSPDQERAMMVRGKGIIAAGAGSGKTATLASKVAYHINELGVPPGAVVATSFSRKSAAELRRRIAKYGADIPDAVSTGFGTTHSVAGKLLREYGNGGRNGMKGYQQTDLVRLAMEQVQMPGPGVPPPAPKNLFDVSEDAPVALKFRDALQMAFDRRQKLDPWSKGFVESFFNPSDQWYAKTMRATKNLTDPRGLSDKQREIVKKVFHRLGITYSPSTDPALQPQSQAKMAASDKNKGLREKYKFFSQPANEWFNLGLELVEEDAKGNKKPIPIGFFKNAISKFKGRAVSPSEAWAISGGAPEAAVYAAYEWLKGSKGETDFQGMGDHDDLLLDVSKMLLSSPRVMQQVQSRFKVVLVDEAQDLNRAQHLMFGLITGFVDPAKVPNIASAKKMGELAKDDGSMTADTYCFIGDDKQCVEANSMVETQKGPRRVKDLAPGDEVLAFRNGKVLLQAVRHVVPSSWTWGYKVMMESGQTLAMSPNHKLWASEPQTEEGQIAVYLMYRKDMGFRVGITNKGKVGSEDDYLNSYGGRVFLEKAERLWILDICSSREEALLTETDLSLTYGIPTTVFNGEHRDLNQERINAIFQKHGSKGARLLEERNLSFDLPHWMSQSYTKHGRERHTVQFLAHSTSGSQVTMEWEGDKFDKVLDGVKFSLSGDRRRLRRWFGNYREGLAHAEDVARRTGANLSYRMATPEGVLRETTASGLFIGMSLPVLDRENEAITLDRISSIERVDGCFIDLDVLDASNFFANGILTSNSIYEFRAADPEAFIDMSELVEGGAGFKTEVLKTNYRSGQLIVDAANRLISYNTKQIPMTCASNPQRVASRRSTSRRSKVGTWVVRQHGLRTPSPRRWRRGAREPRATTLLVWGSGPTPRHIPTASSF